MQIVTCLPRKWTTRELSDTTIYFLLILPEYTCNLTHLPTLDWDTPRQYMVSFKFLSVILTELIKDSAENMERQR